MSIPLMFCLLRAQIFRLEIPVIRQAFSVRCIPMLHTAELCCCAALSVNACMYDAYVAMTLLHATKLLTDFLNCACMIDQDVDFSGDNFTYPSAVTSTWI